MEDLCPGRSSRPESGNSRKASGSHFCVRVLLVLRQHTVPVSDVVAAVQMRRPSEPRGPSLWCRWESLVQMGEVSAARQALEGASLAPGNLATLGMLTDPTRRPPVPRSALSQEVRDTEPAEPVALDPLEFLTCLRKARRGAAAGPSGMTSDHLFPMLENEGDSQRLVEVASALAMARVPEEIIEAIRLGRLTALSKPDGGVRGIVVGDILRRMVARTLAKQISKKVEEATAPFQYALSTKAGCECVAHILQSLTDLSPEVTITSIDGVGAYDLISRNAMLEGLLRMEGGDQILPFVRMFYSNPSTYLWEDELGVTQHIAQGEGGEQGDPLMPLLFALGQHKSLVEAQARLSGNERLLALLDDIYIAKYAGQGFGSTHHCGRRAFDPRTHPPPPRQNQSVESWWCGA